MDESNRLKFVEVGIAKQNEVNDVDLPTSSNKSPPSLTESVK